jgi:hypothetical protein
MKSRADNFAMLARCSAFRVEDGRPRPQMRTIRDFSGGWEIGPTYQEIGGPPEYKWFWSLALNGPHRQMPRPCSQRGIAQSATPSAWERGLFFTNGPGTCRSS